MISTWNVSRQPRRSSLNDICSCRSEANIILTQFLVHVGMFFIIVFQTSSDGEGLRVSIFSHISDRGILILFRGLTLWFSIA